jgi:hypothetical protein
MAKERQCREELQKLMTHFNIGTKQSQQVSSEEDQ